LTFKQEGNAAAGEPVSITITKGGDATQATLNLMPVRPRERRSGHSTISTTSATLFTGPGLRSESGLLPGQT
jgi:hypothetical protein